MPVLENARQERFCQCLIRGMTQVDAYERAGYQPDDGAAARLSGNVRVQARVTELNSEAAEAAKLTREWVITRLTRLAERCMQAVPVLDSEGRETGMYQFNAAGANGALKTLKEMLPVIPEAKPHENDDASDKPLTKQEMALMARLEDAELSADGRSAAH